MPLLNTVMNNRLVRGTARIRLERDALAPGARLNRPSALFTWRLFFFFYGLSRVGGHVETAP